MHSTTHHSAKKTINSSKTRVPSSLSVKALRSHIHQLVDIISKFKNSNTQERCVAKQASIEYSRLLSGVLSFHGSAKTPAFSENLAKTLASGNESEVPQFYEYLRKVLGESEQRAHSSQQSHQGSFLFWRSVSVMRV